VEFRQQQLDNGLTVWAECNPDAYSTSVGMFVRTGARDETPEIGGVSHFLEHMVFKGTPTRTAEQVNRELDDMGSYSNARTGEESTVYYSTVLPEFQTNVVELLCDIMRPSLREDDFEMEKNVIIEEIKMYDDQPPYGGHEKIMTEYFGSHPLGQSVLGTTDSVGGLSADRMREYFQSTYSPNNIALVAAGNVDFDKLVDDTSRCAGAWEKSAADRKTVPASPTFGFQSLHKPQSTQEYIIQLGDAPSSESERRFASRVASVVYGAETGSRMFWEFIDSGLAESAGAGCYEYQGAGLLMNYVCCAPEQAQEIINRLYALQQKVMEDGFNQRELDLAKRKIAAQIILGSERPGNRLFSIGAKWLNGQPYETVAEIARHYELVTLDEINAIARDCPMTQNMTLVVGPRADLKPATV
jgi:predicted Zn-dependent peptidase